MKIVKWFFGLVLLAFLGTELNKAYWDSKVRAMCEKDGGVTVFEVVHLTKEQYEKNDGYKGVITVASESTSNPNHDFYWKSTEVIIKKTTPQVVRSEYVTYRKTDEKALGKWVTYSRRGGDLPVGFHPSSFSCRQVSSFQTSTAREIFIIEKE
ncbi:MAG: hypothetical protein R3E62_05540 [Pseudomonadales bacterium]